MRSWTRWAVLAVVLALSASMSRPALADYAFPDCSEPAYRARFDPRLAEVTYDCVERMRVHVSASSGERDIRIVHDRNASWAARPEVLAEFDRGVRRAAEAFARLGGADLDHVTILLADDFAPPEGASVFSDIAAYTNYERSDECRIVVYLLGPAGTTRYAAFVVAHELFHCVQVANLSREQMYSGGTGTGAGGDWWLEGSANWFAALALPDITEPFEAYVDSFDELSPTTSLNEMAYGAAVFFFWLGRESSPDAVITFLRGMASSNTASAQHAAMSAALSQERWLDFAEAYLDRDIAYPGGTFVPVVPAQGEIWEWSATQTRTAALQPFVLHRGVAAFQCGHWATSVNPAAMHSARTEDGGEWAALPSSIDTSSGSGGSYRLAAINTRGSSTTLSVRGTMESGCGNCAGVSTLDACVVGSWQLTGGGPAEWMRRQGVPGNFSTSGQSVTFRADGSYLTGAMSGEMEVQRDDTRGEGYINAQAGGRWSTSGGVLNMCADSQSRSGQLTITNPETSRTMAIGGAPPMDSSERYSCSASNLSTERDIPGASPMPFEYTRTGGR